LLLGEGGCGVRRNTWRFEEEHKEEDMLEDWPQNFVF
jgi:hypothetical protein